MVACDGGHGQFRCGAAFGSGFSCDQDQVPGVGAPGKRPVDLRPLPAVSPREGQIVPLGPEIPSAGSLSERPTHRRPGGSPRCRPAGNQPLHFHRVGDRMTR